MDYRSVFHPLWIIFNLLLIQAAGQSRNSDYQPINGDVSSVATGSYHQEKVGLFPSVFNLAADAEVTANATCGQLEPEIYCRLVEHVYVREPQCGVCDDGDLEFRHPITNVIDGTNSRWQSPTLQNGRRFEWVTITLDLKQVYQVAYVVVKSAISPRPGNWILERSIDGVTFLPWQFYALSDGECLARYGIEPREGSPTYRGDTEVICTSYYSKLDPLEDGEIHTSLIKGRPGASLPSAELLEFTRARYVRLRLQKIRTLNADLMSQLSSKNIAASAGGTPSEADRSLYQRLFYSIKDISIGGQCVCNGHASSCPYHPEFRRAQCRCEHNTCGSNCDRCCPLFNQRPWKAGTAGEAGVCQQCQCHGHARECRYDPQVENERKSLSIQNIYQGGGVCLNCTDFTTGINCESCLDGYYRPAGSTLTAPCLPCDCNSEGSLGQCAPTGQGQCQCRQGFAGLKCDRCAPGYHSFPNCEPCACDTAGISDPSCRSPCQCKANVEGDRCDRCKSGFFDLREENPEGCSRCFCFDRSGRCIAADLGLVKINSKKGWLVTDLLGRRVVTPTSEKDRLSIANDDMADFESYYWLAPADYLGKKLTAYSQVVKFQVAWVKARGDSAGKATKGPDVIMEGGGMKIGYGDRSYHRDSNTTISWTLRESKHWYHIPDTVQDIVRRRRTEYKGEAVTKTQLMTVLNDLQRLLIRAKFHTDQIEGVLHDAELDIGSESSQGERARGIEQCSCPPGYAGLSCEECAFGYVRRNSSRRGEFECLACQCNGHATTCSPDNLTACSDCLHNTIGAQCESCAKGYFGDARSGRTDACKRCRCPLELASNNFSPTCVTTGPDNYLCDQCPRGYEGHHCQRCSEGYFGNPLEPGGFCQPCDCSNNHEVGSSDWCDRLTGQCLKCKPGTAGQACQLCAIGFYGNATEGTCKECHCYGEGSASDQCDMETGQCQCKDNFIGRHCNRCKDGYGDIKAGCRDCQCDLLGSVTAQTCDGQTGQCQCKPGVGGLTCNQCLEHHYDFSINGCQGCSCNQSGSKGKTCNIMTGQCECRPNVIGLKCNQCQDGFWNLVSGRGCQLCGCDVTGALNGTCHPTTGACYCLPGIGGQACDQCLPGFYGFSSSGCRECEPCNKPGHVCDPDTGRCVCPAGTEGPQCQTCAAGTWNYHPVKGCKTCNCHSQGSRSSQCDQHTGACHCKPGFAGMQCDRCVQPGYYGFPLCQPCDCHPTGTDTRSNGGQCDQNGQCPCKINVMGRQCDTCKESTFGLLYVGGQEEQNQVQQQVLEQEPFIDDGGCTPCFCFGRSSSCAQAQLVWSQMRMEGSRGLMITYDPPGPDAPNVANPNQFPVNTQEICYINLALPGDGKLQFKTGETQLNVTNNLRIVPDVRGDVMIGVSQFFDTPLYWQLPGSFLRDRTTSYNGLLRFTVTNHGGSTLFPDNILATYPLVQIQGNRKVILEYYPPSPHPNGRYQVRLHESLWRMKNNPQGKVSRMMMMIALQNVQHILIRATDSMDRTKAELKDVSLEVALPPTNTSFHTWNTARGVETCQCPSEYTGGSCQDPHRGYFRRYKYDYVSSTILIDLVGEANPCQCNGRSETCDRETGQCTNCRENTTGDQCQLCAKGYYGEPNQPGGCRPCACPSTDRNFADSCQLLRNGSQSCSCSRGYRGDRCQKCDYGYYGNPAQGISCQPCLCNVNGSVSDECEELSGQCNCKPGITGRDCTYCAPRHVISPAGCASCEDGCTGDLFDEVDQMSRSISRFDFNDYVPLPWTGLFHHQNTTILLERTLIERREEYQISDRLVNAPNILPLAQITLQRAREMEEITLRFKNESADLQPICSQSMDASVQIASILEEIIAYLRNYAIGETPSININKAVTEAESHWQYIQSIDVNKRKANAVRELERSKNLLNSVKNLFDDGSDTAQIRDNLEGFKIRLDDLESYIYKSRNTTEAAFHSLAVSNSTLDFIRSTTSQITAKSNQIDINLNLARKKNVNASLALSLSRVSFQGLKTSLDNLKDKKSKCSAKESELSRLNPEFKRKYVIEAQIHANNLWQQAQSLFNQFNATRDVADHPLQAANAYKSIVEALKLARQAAESAGEAAETAYGRAYPDDMDLSLVEQARISRERSRDLLVQSERLQVVVSNHKEQLKGERMALDSVETKLKKAKSINDETIANMDKLPQVRDRAKAAVEKSTDAMSQSTRVSKQILDIQSQINSELKVRLLALQNGRNVGVGNVPKQIEEARKNMKLLDSKLSHLTKKNFEFRSINSSVSLKLDELRKKIMRAKQAASSIRVSLSGKSGSCSRSFTLPLQPSSMSSIMLTYAFNHADRDSLLFYLPSSKKNNNDKESDYLAIEMVGRQIRFLWNAGGGTTVLTHPLKLQPSPDDLSDDSRWYKIEAERTGNVGTLRVWPVKSDNGGHSDGVSVTGAGPPRFTKLDLTTGDKLYIGRVPDSPPSDLKTSKFNGHLHQLWFDGQPIGLWNFMSTSTGCSPSVEGAQEAKDESSFRFNGQGYAELAQIPRYDSRQYSITFSFKSLDENALLFLAINDTIGQYISLELTEGLIRYQVRYGSGYEMSLQSRQKYNTGQWIKVEASRVLIRGVETALLKVADDEELSAAPFNFGVPDLELEEARLYVGGLPPDVSIPSELMGSVPGSFLGCMKDLQVVAFGMNPLQGSFYGVEASCSSKTINKIVAFSGTGFIQLRAARPGRDLNLGLSFKTESMEGILLFAAPIPAESSDEPINADELHSRMPLKSEKEADMMSLTIRQGKIDARFRSSPSEVVSVTSSNTYNDGQFHNVVVLRTGRKVEVLVDDISVGTVRLARSVASSSVSSSDFSHLMLGGVRPEWLSMAADFIGIQHSFTGCIADLSFNNQLIDLSYPVRHASAAVGRCQHVPVPRMLEERMQANENALSSCREVPQYTIEGRAFKFGDAPNSHVMISANRKELHNSFNFTMDFRTHYPNGLLLFSSMKQKKAANYLLVALKNGKVIVSLHGRRKEDMVTDASVNDGHWHRVHIIKEKRKVMLMLDDFAPLRAKAPNKLQLDGQLFVGGLPETTPGSLPLLDNAAAEGFKGCIRNLNLNGRSHDLASSKNVIQRVGQCFAHVETGSYFPGDAYAVYSEDFRVGAMADIQLEFRTTELNGVLLSVSERKGSPSLSLAIDDGTIVFAVDMGDNRTFSVSQSFPSPYQLCDNRWHSVKANYVENALTLKVDNLDEQYGFSTNGHVKEAKTRNPLFIGGLPELEPQGALRVRDNFKGCIRNVVIRGEIKDWTDMARLNNVLLNACPIH